VYSLKKKIRIAIPRGILSRWIEGEARPELGSDPQVLPIQKEFLNGEHG
jgi:hypothetical protein